MKTFVIANQKGGVGKTVIACHLSLFLQERGAKVLHIDLDPQDNSSKTLKAFNGSLVASSLFIPAPKGSPPQKCQHHPDRSRRRPDPDRTRGQHRHRHLPHPDSSLESDNHPKWISRNGRFWHLQVIWSAEIST